MPSKLEKTLSDLGFPRFEYVLGRSSIADIFQHDKRCGIYILSFTNEELYAGQAIDVTRRYVQHRKKHTDLESISFKQIPPTLLDETERQIIWRLEKEGFLLRNISLTSLPKGASDFDLVMTEKFQQKWLSDCAFVDNDGSRVINPELRLKHHTKFQQFLETQHAREIIPIMRKYVQRGIPAFKKSELSFWACSCMPLQQKDFTVYARINVNWQEVFSVSMNQNDVWYSWQMARSVLEAKFGESLWRMRLKYPLMAIHNHLYQPGGSDQVRITCNSTIAPKILKNESFLTAIRLFNYRLMKKGPCNVQFSRSHCMDLADLLVE